jgi:hypothetical protein
VEKPVALQASARIFLGQRLAYEPRCDVVQARRRRRDAMR